MEREKKARCAALGCIGDVQGRKERLKREERSDGALPNEGQRPAGKPRLADELCDPARAQRPGCAGSCCRVRMTRCCCSCRAAMFTRWECEGGSTSPSSTLQAA